MNKTIRIKELVRMLNMYCDAYYNANESLISDKEFDKLYDELLDLEKETGIVLSNSPTQHVGYEVKSELQKVKHSHLMMSLDKTKDVNELIKFIGNHKCVLMNKIDGLTIAITYKNGELVRAETRGNATVGELVTHNVKVFENVPLHINYPGHLEVEGEAIITYNDFDNINDTIKDPERKYKNPRNLCSGSVRQLNNQITAKRNVMFYAFTLVQADGVDFQNSRACQMEWLKAQGFTTVEYHMVTRDTVEDEVAKFSSEISKNDFPSDGLVLSYDDIAYGRSLGRTAKFPRDSYAFKWQDEIRETILREIEWSPSRTGLINPVAIFDPVELEGTTVSRASVHNISIMEELELGIGDKIEVYKANMIIPQIAENLTRSGVKDIPERCPVCQGETKIRQVGNAKALYCMNPECQAKHVKAFALFVSRDALNIEGLSEATLEKFISKGYIHTFADIFHLDRYKDEIQGMEGFGEKSYRKLIESVEKARTTTLPRVVYSLGIAGIGLANAKVICRELKYDVEALLMVTEEELNEIQGVGEVLAKAFTGYFSDAKHVENFRKLLEELTIPEETSTKKQIFEGVNFVITGSVTHFANRGEVKELIESLGGKVTGSVTSKTNYLINNDVTSTSSKNKKANELGIPIISEETFLELVNQEES